MECAYSWYFCNLFAAAVLSVSVSAGPATAQSAGNLCYRESGDKAIAACSKAIAQNPREASYYYNRANEWSAKDDEDKAIADYNEAIRLNPQKANCYYARGKSWERKGNLQQASIDFKRFTELAPSDADGPKAIARIAEKLKSQPGQPQPQVVQQTIPQQQAAISLQQSSSSSVVNPGRRVALIIGNTKYLYAPALSNPINDIQLLASTLRSVGFQSVVMKADLTREQTIQSLREFSSVADSADWAIVYYSGHGIESGGMNYMIPIDAQLKVDRDIDFETVDVGKVLSSIEGAKRLRLVILDACRDNPFASQMRRTMASRSVGRGLARVEPEAGTLVVYAAKHGETALDGDGSNSPFVESLVRRILERPPQEIRRLFDLVRDDVMETTQRKQQPFSYGSLSGREDFYFVN